MSKYLVLGGGQRRFWVILLFKKDKVDGLPEGPQCGKDKRKISCEHGFG